MNQIHVVMCDCKQTTFPVRAYERVADAREYIRLNPSVNGYTYYLDTIPFYSAEYVDKINNVPPYQVVKMDEVGGYSVVDYFFNFDDAVKEAGRRGLRDHVVKRTIEEQ